MIAWNVKFPEYGLCFPCAMRAVTGQLTQVASCSSVNTFVGPMHALLDGNAPFEPNQLAKLAESLPSSIQHLLLEISAPWDPNLLLNTSRPLQDSLRMIALPQSDRLYIRYRMWAPENPTLALLDLAEYFSRTQISFSFIIDITMEITDEGIGNISSFTGPMPILHKWETHIYEDS